MVKRKHILKAPLYTLYCALYLDYLYNAVLFLKKDHNDHKDESLLYQKPIFHVHGHVTFQSTGSLRKFYIVRASCGQNGGW